MQGCQKPVSVQALKQQPRLPPPGCLRAGSWQGGGDLQHTLPLTAGPAGAQIAPRKRETGWAHHSLIQPWLNLFFPLPLEFILGIPSILDI